MRYIADSLDSGLGLGPDKREVVEYALWNVAISTMTLAGALISGLILGAVREMFIALFTGAAFRWSTGGAHLAKPYRCVVISVGAPSFVAVLSKWAMTTPHAAIGACVFAFALASLIIHLYAPADTKNKPIPVSRRAILRAWACLSLAAWAVGILWLLSSSRYSLASASALGLMWQVISVTPAGYGAFRIMDRAFARIGM